jgi:hypothetical protein
MNLVFHCKDELGVDYVMEINSLLVGQILGSP